jgi:hypothetical protein
MAVASLWFIGGCDGQPAVDSSTTEATVKGVVKVGNALAKEGEIIFNPANSERKDVEPRRAPIGKDGTYTIKTLTGGNEVRLGGTLAHKNQVLSQETRSINVHEGENTFDFEAKGGK